MRAADPSSSSTTGTVPGLGPYPDGDPSAIRAVAADLRHVAGRLSCTPRPQVAGWKSAAAGRVRAQLAAAAAAAGDRAQDLRACAASLDHAADMLESDQRAWRLAKRRLEESAT